MNLYFYNVLYSVSYLYTSRSLIFFSFYLHIIIEFYSIMTIQIVISVVFLLIYFVYFGLFSYLFK